MLYSRSYIFTQKESPHDAEIVSHKLMLRAGLIRKSAVGLYTWMPLGKKVLDKVIKIVKQEMDKTGALEILPPFVTLGELWKESGRWDIMGPEMLKVKDRHDHDLVLGPTHEEAFTAVVRETAQSYKDFPVMLYQINTKFRDEIRPRYGVIRCREFIMKDSYSFDIDENGLNHSYLTMRTAYLNIFKKIGLNVDPVLADSGNMGGTGSEEFMVPSSVGEEEIVRCKCGYAANVERAESVIPSVETLEEEPLQKISTPDIKTIQELTQFLGIDPSRFIKSIIYEADGRLIMACIRGDLQVCDSKLKKILQAQELLLADPQCIYDELSVPIGFLGPVGLDIEIVGDNSVLNLKNAVTGANQKDVHYQHVSVERDITFSKTGSFYAVDKDHSCISCGKHSLEIYKGIEVGHIFKLGYKYSHSMQLSVLDQHNQQIYPLMGSYGLGIGRTIAAVIEQNADENGIRFPLSIAPYSVIIVPTISEFTDAAFQFYHKLQNFGVEVLLDDRDERPGIKFKDADLLGIPIRITIGRAWKEEKKMEIKLRLTDESLLLDEQQTLEMVKNLER